MPLRKAIVVGDTTTHGGVVISGTHMMSVMGRNIALVGDMVQCPKCKGVFPIIEGAIRASYMGRNVALEGMKTSCGAKLIGSQILVHIEDGFGTNHAGDAEKANLAEETKEQNKIQYYPQQLVLKNNEARSFSNFKYEIKLSDGRSVSGQTDDSGCTDPIQCEKPVQVEEVKVISDKSGCCSAFDERSSSYTFVVTEVLEPVAIIGKRKEVKLEPDSRLLTAGEIALAMTIFKNSIDYSKVRVHKGEYSWFEIQNNHTAMTPDGEMYSPDLIYKNDFSLEDIDDRKLFLHEMVHIWQYQMGYSVKLVGLWLGIKGGYGKKAAAYRYKHLLPSKKDFSEFNMEQQGRLIEHLYAGREEGSYVTDFNIQRIMARFLRNPNDTTLLPQTTDF